MKRLLLIAFIFPCALAITAQNYILQSTLTPGSSSLFGTTNSAIYQDANNNIGIGNSTPGAVLDVTGLVNLGSGSIPTVINPEYTYVGPVGYNVPSGSPNYFVASRVSKGAAFPPGSGFVYSAPQTDFMIGSTGQTGIGDVNYPSIDLRIRTHAWPTVDNPLGAIVVDDDNGLTLFCVQNVGTSANSCGYMFVHSNSAGASNPAIAVLDQAHYLNPMFMVTSDGVVSTGIDRGIGAVAQLDVMLNNSVVDNLFHVGTYGEGAAALDFFTITNGGYVGVGKQNPGNALLEVSDVYGLGTTFGIPQFTIDDGAGHNFFNVLGTGSGTAVSIGGAIGPTGIGSGTFSNYSLSVDGQIVAKEIVVTTTGWEDTVFSNNYQLKPLADVESYIQRNHHLPDVPAADEVVCTGISLGDMNKMLMQKVEELTLYTINLEKRLKQLEAK